MVEEVSCGSFDQDHPELGLPDIFEKKRGHSPVLFVLFLNLNSKNYEIEKLKRKKSTN